MIQLPIFLAPYSYNSSINVSKANLIFNITSQDIKVGHDAIITIIVPPKTEGVFKINGDILNIPMSGELLYVIPNLGIGEYEFIAYYEGTNFNNAQNSTSFKVSEFSTPILANDGINTENMGKSAYSSNANGNVYWVNQINSTVQGNLAIDSDGNLYIITLDGIYSLNSDGTLRWIYNSDGLKGNFSGISIARDIIISPRSGDRLYFINQSSGSVYGYSNIYQASSLFSPVVSSNATIYVVSEYQYETSSYNLAIVPYRIWETGGDPVLISLNNKPISAPTFNDDVIVILSDGQIRVIDLKSFEDYFVKTGNFKNIRPVIGEGNIIHAIFGDYIYAFTLTGEVLWNTRISEGSGDILLLNPNVGIYATNCNGNIYCYDLLSGEETLISDLTVTSGILIDFNDNLYFGSNNMFYAIDKDGNIIWKTDLGSKITGTPVMNNDGVIYVTSIDNKVFALSNATKVDDLGTNTNSSDVNSDYGNVAPASTKNPTHTTKKVTKKASKITAKNKTFKKSKKIKKYTITLNSGKTLIKKVKVTIKIGKKTYTAKTNAKGKATFKIKKLTKKSKYTALIKFGGSSIYKPSTKKVKIVVK